ncbi:MAG: ABC transporter permease [Bacteroidota bacterium]|jgi:lipopolysaccharide transport system permease protein
MNYDKIEYEIKPVSKFSWGLGELWKYRELLYFFVWRDLKIKYKQTFLGVLWVVLQPLMLMLIFTFVLGARLENSIGKIGYPVFFMSGFILWNFFSSGLTNAGNGMVSNAGIIKKIYFPRLIIPVSSVLSATIDLFVGFLLYIIILIFYKPDFNVFNFIYLPLSIILTFSASLGLGIIISSLNIKYRDFRYLLPFLIQFLLFVSPVIYVLSFDSVYLNFLVSLNPMYAPIELFRSHLANYQPDIYLISISVFVNLVFCFFGIFYFRKTESYFADLA